MKQLILPHHYSICTCYGLCHIGQICYILIKNKPKFNRNCITVKVLASWYHELVMKVYLLPYIFKMLKKEKTRAMRL